ncbi:unnamed protein product, partial [Chrysoparadoxa australica]
MGAVLGASIFTSTIIVGWVASLQESGSTPLERLGFMRDTFFYIAVAVLIMCTSWYGEINIGVAAGYLVVYVIYVWSVLSMERDSHA